MSESMRDEDKFRKVKREQGITEEQQDGEDMSKTKAPALLKRICDKMSLDIGILITMLKGALPPTISLAIYQARSVDKIYSTIGYLVAIMSILSFAIQPRARFIFATSLNSVGVCIGAASCLLAVYCSIQARKYTTTTPKAYNSSASAVTGLFLFFNIYIANAFRASRPQLQTPVILYSIFTMVALTNVQRFTTLAQGITFTKQLLEAFFTGFAIATGVSLFVFPVSCRTIFFKQAFGFVGSLQGVLKTHAAYMQSLENGHVLCPCDPSVKENKQQKQAEGNQLQLENSETSLTPEATKLKTSVRALAELHSKIQTDLPNVKREIAYGKLDAEDIADIFQAFRHVLLPVLGLGTVVDIFGRISEWREINPPKPVNDHNRDMLHWSDIMKTMHRPFQAMTEAMIEGLEHTLYSLELASPPKESGPRSQSITAGLRSDVEAQAEAVRPGDTGYGDYLAAKVADFHKQREAALKSLYQQNGLDSSQMPTAAKTNEHAYGGEDHRNAQKQIHLILYMDFIVRSITQAILELVRLADLKVEKGVMSKKRIILPGSKRLKKWLMSSLKVGDTPNANLDTPDSAEGGTPSIYLGDSLRKRKDPEHLPPANWWQRLGDEFRAVSHSLGSLESAFGFRAACATMSIAIVAYLEVSQLFFVEQRLVWAMIMVAIGMTTTAGSGVFGLFARVAGTTIAMCSSLIIWYMAGGDGNPAGVLILLFVLIFVTFYFVVKYPRCIVIALLSMVTATLVLGYELQVRRVGIAASIASGQLYYPIKELSPYRLATVAGGCFVAFVWTFVPYPLTERSALRKDSATALFLLANFYSCVHTTIGMRIRGEDANGPNGSSYRQLEKARNKVFSKELVLLAGLRQHLAFTSWEPAFGGRFPKKQYEAIVGGVQRILDYMALIAYASNEFSITEHSSQEEKKWMKNFSAILSSVDVTSQEITSTLSLMSASLMNGTPLPPYLQMPSSYQLVQKLEALDVEIMSLSHIAESGFAAFATIQVASSLINDDMNKLVENVKSLVGVVDFSFHVISTSASSSDETLWKGKSD